MSLSIEGLIPIVQGRHEEGEDIGTIIDELIEGGDCSPEEANLLREHFEPSVATDTPPPPETPPPPDTPSVGVTTPLPSLPELANSPKRSAPTLRIDWGRELVPGVSLSPIFTIQGGSFQCRPLVYFSIDDRIEQKSGEWKKIPELEYCHGDSSWKFDQKLTLNKDREGQYLFRIIVINPEPGFSDPACYHSTFRMDVDDPKGAGQRTLKIHSDDLIGDVSIPKGFTDVEIIAKRMTALVSGDSVIDKAFNTNKKSGSETVPDWITTIRFNNKPDLARQVPYLAQPSAPELTRLTMTESASPKNFILTGGRHLNFGRDIPEENYCNDVSLEVPPGTPEELIYAHEFTILNKLFSRAHARLEVDEKGVHLADIRQGGIQDATILGEKALNRGGIVQLFSNDTTSHPQTVLFSKILAMQFTPYYETLLGKFHDIPLNDFLPDKKFPPEWLEYLYSLRPFTQLSSIGIKPEQYLKQKPHTNVLLFNVMKETPLSKSDWWQKWFAKTTNINPYHKTHEYWFIPLLVTLGRYNSTIKLQNPEWGNVQLRILFVNKSLYVENHSRDDSVEYEAGGYRQRLAPFRPQPLCPGFVVRRGKAELRFG